MNVKEFKTRWLRGYIQPDLFKLPLKSESIKKTGNLGIQIGLYNTLNLETMEYSNTTGYSNLGVSSHIVIFNSKGQLIYNSKQKGIDPTSYFYLKDVPYGIYKIKVISVKDGGIVDNQFHYVTVDNEDVNCRIYLKYFWTKEVLYCKKESPEYFTNCDSSFEFTNVNIKSYISHIDVFDEQTQQLLCTAPYENNYSIMFTIGSSSQTFGSVSGSLYTDKYYMDFSCSYKYRYRFRSAGSTAGTVLDQYGDAQGNVSYQTEEGLGTLNNSTYKSTTCLRNMYRNIAKNYEKVDFPQAFSASRIYNVNCTRDMICTEVTTGRFIQEINEEDNGYVYTNIQFNTSTLYRCVTNAMFYYRFSKDTINEINQTFFGVGNFLIIQNTNTNRTSSIKTWNDYQRDLSDIESGKIIIVKVCGKYDVDKFYLKSGLTPYDFTGYGVYDRYNQYFNIVYPTDKIATVGDYRYTFTGYVKSDEMLSDSITRHTINTQITTYSDDYDQY